MDVAKARPYSAGRNRLAIDLLALLVLALLFQGSRGLWEPDEGYYSNAALEMIDQGGWLVPRLNGEPFLDKPPLVYWTLAAGVALVGRNEWGLRYGNALLLIATSMLVGAAAGRIAGSRARRAAPFIYMTLPLPFIAANVLTPDTPLAFGLALALYGLVRVELTREGRAGRLAWSYCGIGFSLAFLAKGPAALPFAAAALLHQMVRRRMGTTVRNPWTWVAVALALTPIGLWYAGIANSFPGSATYLFDHQVMGRLVSDHLERNSGWTGWFRVYLPTLVVGLAPWGLWALRPLVAAFRSRAPSLGPDGRQRGVDTLLALWFLIPFAIFSVAQSRLPFYLLPLAAPVALLATRRLVGSLSPTGSRPKMLVRLWLVAAIALVAIKAVAAAQPHYRDSRAFARELDRSLPESVHRLISVDVNRNALPLYRRDQFEWVTADPEPYPFYSPLESFDEEVAELARCSRPHALIVSERGAPGLLASLTQAGQSCFARSLDRFGRLLFCEPTAPSQSADIPH